MYERTYAQNQDKNQTKRRVVQKSKPVERQAIQQHPMTIIQRIRMNPMSMTQNDIIQLQSTIGNKAVHQLISQIHSEKDSKAENKTVQLNKGKTEEIHPVGGNGLNLPVQLKAGLESLSNIDLSDVQVHYNSEKPKDVGALAYTQGNNIHIAPGQEKFLPHEGWHAVQQKQGRVKPTLQMKMGVTVNDDAELEREADILGGKATTIQKYSVNHQVNQASYPSSMQLQKNDTIQRVPWTSLSDFKSDWAGRDILWHYLYGKGKELNLDNDKKWTKYMKNDGLLTSKTKDLVKRYAAQVEISESKEFDDTTSMEIENGEQIIGYQFLHGTNADVGGFKIKGTITKDKNGNATIKFTYQWNDRIDPNFIYESDSKKAKFAKSIPLAKPTDYTIRINWSDTAVLNSNGIFISGWLATDEPKTAPSPSVKNKRG